jgi:serine/threonine-protein kinase
MNEWMVPGYTRERDLGSGAHGHVVAAVSDATGLQVAIKYLHPRHIGSPGFLAAFRAEAELLKSLDVPQVVRLYDYVEEPGRGAAIVMELVEGASLRQLISGPEPGPLDPLDALAVLKGSLLGLAAAHEIGVVHRDYKPENVLLDARENSKLSDFGIAVRAGRRAAAIGTPPYMAPEQWVKGATATPASDIYAATAVFYECLTARPPFSGNERRLRWQHLRAAVPLDEVDEKLHGLITAGLAKDPRDRPASAAEFAAELDATVTAAYGPDWEARGRRHLAIRVAALLLLLLRGNQPAESNELEEHGAEPAQSPAGASEPAVRGRGWRLKAAAAAVAAAMIAWLARGRRRAIAAIAAAVAICVAVTATALALAPGTAAHPRHGPQVRQAVITAFVRAVKPVIQASCATPGALGRADYAFSAQLASSGAGVAAYRWVFSSGWPEPVQHARFKGVTKLPVPRVTPSVTEIGPSGRVSLELLGPHPQFYGNVPYRVICRPASGPDKGGHSSSTGSGSTGTSTSGPVLAAEVSAKASVSPASPQSVTCGAPPPAVTYGGRVTSNKPGTLTYYFEQSDGRRSPPGTLTFPKAESRAVQPWTVTPSTDPDSLNAELVVQGTGTVATATSATYTLSCTAPLRVSAMAHAAVVHESGNCATAATTPGGSVFTGAISASAAGPVSYHWHTSHGETKPQTMAFTRPGIRQVSAPAVTWWPGDLAESAQLVITSPSSAKSKVVTSTRTCVQAQDPAIHLTVDAPALGVAGQPYGATVTATGGDESFTGTTGPAVLPDGLTFGQQGATFTIVGTPQNTGSFSFTVQVSDGETPAQTETVTIAFTVYPKLIETPACPASAVVGQPYSGLITATGGDGQYLWPAQPGAPDGLSASEYGAPVTFGAAGLTYKPLPGPSSPSGTFAIGGIPQQTGTFSVTVPVTDGEPTPYTQHATATCSFTVYSPLQITYSGELNPDGSASVDLGTTYFDGVATLSGGHGPYHFGDPQYSAPLAGLTITSDDKDGVVIVTGTPRLPPEPDTLTSFDHRTPQPVTYQITVPVTDGESPQQTTQVTFTLIVYPPLQAEFLPPANPIDEQDDQTLYFLVRGGDGPYVAVTAGPATGQTSSCSSTSGLPAGFTALAPVPDSPAGLYSSDYNSDSSVVPGSYAFDIQVTDSSGTTASIRINMIISDDEYYDYYQASTDCSPPPQGGSPRASDGPSSARS